MNNKDVQLYTLIKKHYSELCAEKEMIASIEAFVNNTIMYKAIVLDLLQIGENVNKFSDSCKQLLNRYDLKGVTGLRNQLVHGYGSIDLEVVWSTIKNDLPRFIKSLDDIFDNKKDA